MKSAGDIHGNTKVRSLRGKRTGIITTAFAVVCTSSIFAVPPAFGAVPTFPDNLVVFPDRDFITVEGFADRVGQTATVEVSRPGAGVVGSASSLVGAGDVAFEINHPGGVCWGAGTGLNVTPDILPGDTVSIKFDGVAVADTRVQDAAVTGPSTISGNTVTVHGRIAAGVDRAQFEQRIIEPGMKDTDVGRRDVRALPGPLTPSDKGGYSSGVTFDGADTFTATYVFDTPATAQLAAAAGGARAMAWEAADVDDNRQGLTIAEFGETGGPGMGGCPNGPSRSGPVAPTDLAAAPVGGDLKVTWTPAQAIPGTPAITGYRAAAVARTSTNGEQVEIGKRIRGQAATGTTITGLNPDEIYDVYVASVSSVGESFPAARVVLALDGVAPTVSASPDGGTSEVPQQVTLTASEPGADIYYTTDGTDVVLSGGGIADTATRYTGPFSIATTTTLVYAAIDPSGNASDNMRATFTNTSVEPEDTSAPTVTTRTPGADAVGVATGSDTTAAFSEVVTGVTEATVSLRAGNGAGVAAVVTYDATTGVATLDPTADLAPGARYTVDLTAGITDAAGNALAPVSWSFTTAEAPVVVVPAGPAATAAPLISAVASRTPGLGAAGGPVVCGLKDGGCYQAFQGGDVHYSPATGAQATYGAIRARWGSLGYENGKLGYPVAGEVCGLKDGGCYQAFQGGDVHYSPATGAQATYGAIRARWGSLGYENGKLGYPVAGEVCGLKDGGCYQAFQGGDVHYSPATGAQATYGAIRARWGSQGYENGSLGYPIRNEAGGLRNGGAYQTFQGGSVHWSPVTGAWITRGAIQSKWASQGWESGRLGYPISNEFRLSATVVAQDYQGGRITWSAPTGATVTYR
ncbi:Ig-like domain-containing protein [Arthrobacter sp. B0490]|uniref:Ig-like domain-containing protein n=1 Tax=Arthrobacter sp. B0490 TaxID=2058891 RepID=UPI000CE481AB|nr:Ig-like domain-containing protein [Arthrobacter sp. B0490]